MNVGIGPPTCRLCATRLVPHTRLATSAAIPRKAVQVSCRQCSCPSSHLCSGWRRAWPNCAALPLTSAQSLRSRHQRLVTQAAADAGDTDSLLNDAAAAAQRRAKSAKRRQRQQEQQQRQQEGQETSAEASAGSRPQGAGPLSVTQQQQALFEGKYGLPVVRRYLRYEELLRDIRQEKVLELLFFSQRDTQYIEGVCLVAYRDGSMAQSLVPDYEYRIPYAMETHGVRTSLLKPVPEADALVPAKPPSIQVEKVLTNWLPFVGLAAVYAATQFAAKLKGDAEDRKKLRAADKERLRQMDEERDIDQRFMEAEEMATMGLTAEEISANLDRMGIEYTPEKIEKLVRDAAKKRRIEGVKEGPAEFYNDKAKEQAEWNAMQKRKQEEEEGQADTMEKAEQFLQMSTAKLTKAADPEEERLRIKMRAAKRKMKGVNLQYVSDRRVFFDDVAGIGEAKVELQEVVDFFTKPQLFRASGARIPRGVLLCGPPGTGKTLLARAVAGESGVAFLSLNASEFVEMFVGVGAARVRDLFNQARSLRPCIIFMDEIDAVGRTRGGAQGNDERDTTLNQLLSEMDGFGDGGETGVIVMAATNRRDVLDPALIRPGRFDRIIHIGAPDFDGRIEILKVHLAGRPVAEDIDLRSIAFETTKYTGAQLANLVNTAGGFVGKEGREVITMADLHHALEWERLGPQGATPSPERRHRLAVQEGATALIATLLPAIEPVNKVTIAPYQKLPLGHMVLGLNEDRELTGLFTRKYLLQQLRLVLAGRAAEQILYGQDEMSTINQRQLMLARRIAQKLVVSGGLSDAEGLGPGPITHPVHIGGTLGQIVPARVTAATQDAADREMAKLLAEAYDDVMVTLQRNRAALDKTIDVLLEQTTMSGQQMRELVEAHCKKSDLDRRAAEKAAFL